MSKPKFDHYGVVVDGVRDRLQIRSVKKGGEMGYTTEFEGSIAINPPLPLDKVDEVNAFCEDRHGGDIHPYSGMPDLYCDWYVLADGASIKWNGNEKSYKMDKWLPVLIKKFFGGHVLSGTVRARGEDFDDYWVLEVVSNQVSKRMLVFSNA